MTEQERARREHFITGLRNLADFLASHPGIQAPVYVQLNVFVKHREDLAAQARLATFQKIPMGDWFVLRHEFGEDLVLDLTIERQAICKKVQVGTRQVPALPATEATEEPVYDWICEDPLLAPEVVNG